jgi:maltokinase
VIDLHDLQRARWFAGKHRRVAAVAEVGAFGALTVIEVAYGDGGAPERYLLPADGLAWGPLLAELRRAPLTGPAGRIELRASPALATLSPPSGAPEHIPSTDQSNTLTVVGDGLLIKAYRKLEPGVHPEIELGAALIDTAAPVPAHAGSLHLVGPGGDDTAIALLQEFVGGAVSGWEAPIEAAAEALRRDGAHALAPYAAAGAAAAALHAALRERLGAHPAPAATGAVWRATAEAALDEATALDPEAAAAAPAIRRRLAALEQAGPTPLQRIHGDFHYAQLLRTPERTLIIDLEGDPTAPLAARRALDTPLRDLAALLRSIDHIGTAAARRAPGTDPTAFIAAATTAALQAYEHHVPVDRPLLAALELAAECRELVYAHRTVPEWAYAPRAGLRRLLDQQPQQRSEDP